MIFFKLPQHPSIHNTTLSESPLSPPLAAALLCGTAAMAILCFCCVYWRIIRNPATYQNAQLPHTLDQRLIP